jgi:hypothetical protein
MPVLLSGYQLVNTGNSTSITPKTANRSNQINRRYLFLNKKSLAYFFSSASFTSTFSEVSVIE